MMSDKTRLLYDCQKWLRDSYNIHLVINPRYESTGDKLTYRCDVINIRDGRVIKTDYVNSYEACVEEGLLVGYKLTKAKLH